MKSYQKPILPPSISKYALELDQALKDIKVCDPAIGSGAFPVGMMQEIVRAREVLTDHLQSQDLTGFGNLSGLNEKRSKYNFKRHAIQYNLYGVDIDPGAVDIAKLRLWLSLVVDEEDYAHIKPLPNLDYKIVSGNSLLGVEKNIFNYHLFAELEELKPLYFEATKPAKKKKLKEKIDALIAKLTGNNAIFDFEIYFSEIFNQKGGFDVVIGNPPYGANIDDIAKVLEKLYPNTAKSHKDSYKIFIEAGLVKLSNKDGIITYIVPNTLLRQPRYKDVRVFLNKYRILSVINLGENVFEQAVVPTCVFLAQKRQTKNEHISYKDLSRHSKFTGAVSFEAKSVVLGDVFADIGERDKRYKLTLGDILKFKDAGINYQRINVGMGEKGKSDLGQRLLYEGTRENSEDVMFWKGKDIGAYVISPKTSKWVRLNTIKNLRDNERVVLNKTYFETAHEYF